MKNSFLEHPEFLSKDFRFNRPINIGFPVTQDLIIQKHQLLLPPEKIKGKRVLDLGSFIGQTGDWCLSNGASEYVGIEINAELCVTANELLTKYQKDKNWKILNYGVDDYFNKFNDQFDIIFCWGVFHAHADHSTFLKNVSNRAEHIIIECRHPKIMWNGWQDNIPSEFWHELEYNIPYSEWQENKMSMLTSVNESINCTSSNSSISAMRVLMEINGFKSDLTVYEKLKTLFPDEYGMFKDHRFGRYVIEFNKDADVKKHCLLGNFYKNPTQWTENCFNWNKND